MHFVRACCVRGAHPEGTGPLPWPVGPAGPRAGLARRQSDAAQLGPLYDGGAKLGRLLKRGRGCLRARAPPSKLYTPVALLGPHCSTASRVYARRSRPATHPAGAIYASPRFFSCCRAPPSRAFNSVWARPLTVPCFLGTAQQGRKGYNTMYITGNAAVATAVANYRRSLALARMAMANYKVLLNYASDHKHLPPERLRATWRGCITLRNQLQANADAALAVGGITWEEHQAAYRI